MTRAEMTFKASKLREQSAADDATALDHEELAYALRQLAIGRRLEATTLDELARRPAS